MTKEEILEAISDDKMMPYIEPYQLSEIVDFVIKNYKPSLPSDLDEAAEEYHLDIKAKPFGGLVKEAFKAGAEWREAQIPKLPDNLDDAAWNYVAKKYCIKESEKIFENEEIAEDFKAGAEWMAGQGETRIVCANADLDPHGADYGIRSLYISLEDNIPVGTKFIVQIRKK